LYELPGWRRWKRHGGREEARVQAGRAETD
jgi:hypothetical protein